jgi:hypothetical protein
LGVRSVEEFTTFELADERLESLAAELGWHPPQGRPAEQAEFGRPVGVERGKILAFVAPLDIQVSKAERSEIARKAAQARWRASYRGAQALRRRSGGVAPVPRIVPPEVPRDVPWDNRGDKWMGLFLIHR